MSHAPASRASREAPKWSWREVIYELEGAALGLSLAVLTALAALRPRGKRGER